MASSYPKATLDGVELDASAPVQWSLSTGVSPSIHVVQAHKEAVEKVKQGTKIKLEIVAGDLELKALGVYAIGQMEATDKFRGGLLIADQRVYWNRRHVLRRYNIRTRSGEVRRVDVDGNTPLEIQAKVEDVTYKRFSLKDGAEPWTAADVVRDVLDEVAGEDGWSGNLLGFSENTVDSLVIDGDGGTAVAQALSLLVGADIFVDLEGKVQVINTLDDDGTAQMLKKVEGPEFVGTPHPILVDLGKQRPSKIHVLFSPEQGVRFDYYGPRDTVLGDERWFENVAPIPDLTLEVDGETLVQGTYVEFSKLLDAWNADKGGEGVPDISEEVIRRGWFRGDFDQVYGRWHKFAPNANWIRRAATIRAHYRQTFRISPRWMDSIYSFRAYRAAIIDPETGARAPTRIFTDYTILPTHRGREAAGADLGIGASIEGAVKPSEPLSEGGTAMAEFSIVDEEQGIVRFDFMTDQLDHVGDVIPSALVGTPTFDADEWNERTYFSDGTVMEENGVFLEMTEEYNAAFVVTVAPGSPNSTDQLYRREYALKDVEDHLPIGASLVGQATQGEPWYVRVGPQVATARFAWSDEKKGEIEQTMAVGGGEPLERSEIEDLLQNPKEMDEIGKATAAALYASMADRWQGSKTTTLSTDVEPVGSIRAVLHTLSTEGALSTTVQMPEPTTPIDPMALLPASARQLIGREIQP